MRTKQLGWLSALLLALCASCARMDESDSRRLMPAQPALQSLYIQSCYSCHGSGSGGAPRTGNIEQWQPRLAKGMDTLVQHSIDGFKAMPPRGMCINCSRDDYRALIHFMAGATKPSHDNAKNH